MPVEFKDYYSVLGVPRTATDIEIKKAFRKLAAKYHPDVARDKANAENKFKEINEAHEVLGDPEKRRKYDALGANWNRPDWQAAQQQRRSARRGEDEAEFRFGGTGFSDFFEQFFSSRGRGPGGFGGMGGYDMEEEDFAQRGQDVEGDIMVTLDEVLHGSTRVITLQRANPQTGAVEAQRLRVKIPPGVKESQLIRLAGKGGDGVGGGAAGNLYLRVSFARHPDFRVQGTDLYHDLELSPWEAVLGATVQLRTLDGVASLKIPPGTTAGKQFRLRGKGLPAGDGTRGDLHAVVTIEVPERLTAQERALWEQLAAKSAFNPRESS